MAQTGYAYNLPLFNDTLSKKGFIKKHTFNIEAGYEYCSTDGFSLIKSSTINSAEISKSSNGIKTETGLYITPFLKLFINYTFRNSLLDIKYTINKESNKDLVKDYTAVFSRKSNEHIYMAGFVTAYEWTIKRYTPYISFKAGFGGTAADIYEDIFYNASFALKAGTYITFDKNFILNIYAGADYTTLFNSGLMAENININIPDEYLVIGTVNNLYAAVEYQENYDKNINMLLGAELDIYKYSSIFAEMKFINSFVFYAGIKVKF
ncbi:MAG: hypothetical protein K2N11_04705 [Mucispirillum sp.]|nr:hypothetical protein [Mucispirillum sp.]